MDGRGGGVCVCVGVRGGGRGVDGGSEEERSFRGRGRV